MSLTFTSPDFTSIIELTSTRALEFSIDVSVPILGLDSIVVGLVLDSIVIGSMTVVLDAMIGATFPV